MIFRHTEIIREAGETIFPHPEEDMWQWGYNYWYVMIQEYLTRACVIRYLYGLEGKMAANRQIAADERAGFPGIGDLAEQLVGYEGNRDRFPDMETFIPKIAAYFEQFAASYE